MAEWSSPFNPFNSFKSLVHAAHYEAILAGKPKPPIVVNFDLTNICNYACRFCMFGGRTRADPTSMTYRENRVQLPTEYVKTLPKIWKEWGIKAECIGGGGEPTTHPYCLDHLVDSAREGIDVGFVSNGYLMNNKKWWDTVVSNARWVGFSIDAGNKADYEAVKGVPARQFGVVLDNLRGLVEAKKRLGTKCNIGYKFLLDDKNQGSIYDAARIARDIGCNTFQFRPAINPDYNFTPEQIAKIKDQIEKAQREFDSDTFRVFGVTHKFDKDFKKKHGFKKCRATMLTTTWCADGNVYLCTDTRGNPWAKIGTHYPDPKKFIETWGSLEHFKVVNGIDFKKNCDRCTLEMPNEFFEQVFLEDKMERNLV